MSTMLKVHEIRNKRSGKWKGGKTVSEAKTKKEIYSAKLRSRIQTMLNDIKRPIEMSSAEMGLSLDEYNNLFNSDEPADLKLILSLNKKLSKPIKSLIFLLSDKFFKNLL